MKQPLAIIVVNAALALMASGQVIDRVVASVNDRVITQSDWEEQERFESLLEGRDPVKIRLTEASLERLIDQLLVNEQLEALKYSPVAESEMTPQLLQLRKQLKVPNDAAWQALLVRYGLTETDFNRHFSEQLNTLRLVDLRFRPTVQVTDLRIQQYYNYTFVPKLQMQGTPMDKIPKLKDVEDRIRQILTEESMNNIFQTWLRNVRSQAQVRKFVSQAQQ
jgi:parvulin-like peptidyl-prolyl isomerase